MPDFRTELPGALAAREHEVQQQRWDAQYEDQQRQIQADARDRAELRHMDHVGTALGEVLTHHAVTDCQQFLEVMAKNHNKGAALLMYKSQPLGLRNRPVRGRHGQVKQEFQAVSTGDWNIKGYLIGISGEVIPRAHQGNIPWPKGVYVCVDEALRLAAIPQRPDNEAYYPTDLTGYLGDQVADFETGMVDVTYEHTRWPSADGSTDIVAAAKTYWYDFSPQPLATVLARTAAKHLIQ